MALYLVFSIPSALLLGLDSHTRCVKLALNLETTYRFFGSKFLLFHPLFFPIIYLDQLYLCV